MFILKKIISSIITIPGIFIVLLLFSGIYSFVRRARLGTVNIIAGIIIYLLSISPVANFLIGKIEIDCIYNGKKGADAIILLGGGVVKGVKDLSGLHAPSGSMIVRIVDAVRIYRKHRIPIIVSGGSVSSRPKEAIIAKRFLVDLGVDERIIFIEDRSRDTVENAQYVKKIFTERNFKKGLLVTSAFHMRRALMIFRGEGFEVNGHSSGFLTEREKCLDTLDMLPSIHQLRKSAIALKESIGIVFYYTKYIIFN